MKALILHPTNDVRTAAFCCDSERETAIYKAAYERHDGYTTAGTIERPDAEPEVFIEDCFDFTNNPTTQDDWGKRSIGVGSILILMDVGGAYLCKMMGWEKIE